MKLHSLLFFFCVTHLTSLNARRTKIKFPKKTNIIVVVHIGKSNHLITEKILQHVVNGISLRRYRISLYTTNGLIEKILNFQSRKCLVKRLRSFASHRRRYSVPSILRIAKRYDIEGFPKDRFAVLLFTDRGLGSSDVNALLKLSLRRTFQKIYIVNVGYARHVDAENEWLHEKLEFINYKSSKNLEKVLFFVNGHLNSCNEGGLVKDECGRVCDCIRGKVTNCYRIRKEFSSLSSTERERYTNIYKEVSTNIKYKRTYNKYCHIHTDFFFLGIHNTSQFFPWHRRYILGYENMLRTVDCRVTVPVWDWATFSHVAWKITPSYHIWNSIGGFGGNGTYSDGYCVMNGKFKATSWITPRYEDTYSIVSQICNENEKCIKHCQGYSKCLRRRFRGTPPSYRNVKKTLTRRPYDFKKFDFTVRQKYHNIMHNFVGGHMETIFASSTPEFWGHHGMLDNIWATWQSKGDDYKFAAFFGKDVKLHGFKSYSRREHFIDNDNLAGCEVKVRYEVFHKKILNDDVHEIDSWNEIDQTDDQFENQHTVFNFNENGGFNGIGDESARDSNDYNGIGDESERDSNDYNGIGDDSERDSNDYNGIGE